MDIQETTLEQLKAAAYDQIALREQAQKNLDLINVEIAKRFKEADKVEPIEETINEPEPEDE